MTTVVSVRGRIPAELLADPAFVYVGRAMPYQGWEASPFGNPFRPGMTPSAAMRPFLVIPDEDRRESSESDLDVTWTILDCYAAYVRARWSLWSRLPELKRRTLGCWCCKEPWTPDDRGPLACHGQVLAALAEGIDPAVYREPSLFPETIR